MMKKKYLRINLPKGTKDIHIQKTIKHSMKDIKDDTNRWRNAPCSWIGSINRVKMSILYKAIYRFNAIPIKQWYFSQNQNKSFHDLYGNTPTHKKTNLDQPKQS